MVKISTNNGAIQILKTTENQELSEAHSKVLQEHLNGSCKAYTKIEGTISSSEDLAIKAECLNSEKEANICLALIDEIGEYFSIDVIERDENPILCFMSVPQNQLETTKKITLLVAEKLKDGTILNVTLYELKITDPLPLRSAFRGIESA